MELPGTVTDIRVYDDFAHHPTAIATTLDGVRRKIGDSRILAVIEPRSNTMKLGAMAARLPDALRQADLIFCFGAASGKHALGWDPRQVLAPLRDRARASNNLDDLAPAIVARGRPGGTNASQSNR